MAGSRGRGRSRSRKRRPPASAGGPSAPRGSTADAAKASPGTAARRPPRSRTQKREPRPYRDPLSVGERPQAPWHPWPLSELLILVGAIGTVVVLRAGVAGEEPALFASLAAVALGTFEVTLREHRAGYRSHTLLLSFLPVLVFHTAVVLVISAFTTLSASASRVLNVCLLALDAALFTVLFKLWRARFLDARAR